MSRQRLVVADPFGAIDSRILAIVVGGRSVAPGAGGADPNLLQGMQQLVKAVASIGDNLAAAKKASGQQAMQFVMQSVMHK